MKVYATRRGHVYHARKDCEWLAHARVNAVRLGRRVHPIVENEPATWPARKPCRVCCVQTGTVSV